MIRQLFEGQMSTRHERTLGILLLVAGLVIAGASVMRMGPDRALHAQTMQQAQETPAPTIQPR